LIAWHERTCSERLTVWHGSPQDRAGRRSHIPAKLPNCHSRAEVQSQSINRTGAGDMNLRSTLRLATSRVIFQVDLRRGFEHDEPTAARRSEAGWAAAGWRRPVPRSADPEAWRGQPAESGKTGSTEVARCRAEKGPASSGLFRPCRMEISCGISQRVHTSATPSFRCSSCRSCWRSCCSTDGDGHAGLYRGADCRYHQ
jgi:hypothetical protein